MTILSRFAINRPKTTLLLTLLVTIALVPGMRGLHIDSDFRKQIPKTHEIIKSNDSYEKVFGDKITEFIAVVNEKNTIYNPETLQVIAAISEGIQEIPGLIEENVYGLADSKFIKGDGDFLDVSIILEADSIPQTQEELDEFRAAVEENSLFYGKLVSKDGTAGIISFDLVSDFDRPKTDEIIDGLQAKYETADIKIYPTGATVLWDIDEGVANGFSRLVPIAMLLVMVGLFFSFRTLRGVLLPIVLIIFANLWTLGIMGYFRFEFGPVTSIIPVLIIVIGGSYCIHALHRFYEEVAHVGGENLKQGSLNAMEGMGSAVTMAGITSACGALSLLTFKVQSIQIFGISGCIGTLICLLMTLMLIPAILVLLPPPKPSHLARFHGEHRSGLSNFLLKLGNFAMNRKWVVGLVTLILLVGAFIGIKMIRTGQDYIGWFAKDHPVHQAADILNDKLGGSIGIYGLIDGGEPDAMKRPEVLKVVRDFQKFAENEVDGIEVTSSFADIIVRLHKEMNEGQVDEELPSSQDLVSQYLLFYSMGGSPSDFDSLVVDYQQASVMLPAKIHDSHVLEETYNKLNDYAKANFPPYMKAAFGGSNLVFVAIDEYIVEGKRNNMILTLVMVFVFCTVVFRSLSGGLIGVIPIALATVMNFGLMGLLGIRLDMASSIVTGVGVGIGVDFIVHMLFRLKEDAQNGGDIQNIIAATVSNEGTAVIFDTASNVLAFGVFLTSFLLPIRNFGWLVGFIMINSCFATLFVTPAVIHLLKPKFIFGANRAAS